ncbi:MAG: asparagine synthase C-terminal domain-containing protein, partial [Bacteroidota bacterium]
NSLDEPFADSSGILVNLLSRFARKRVKVALSGDGADELFGGYNKHRALLRSLNSGMANSLLRGGSVFLQSLPASRNHSVFNKLRKVRRYSRGLKLDFKERYLEWASFTSRAEVEELLTKSSYTGNIEQLNFITKSLNKDEFNSVLEADFNLVLPNDMLTKVDVMSMHNSLEVRVPFLDHELVDYVFSLPASFKLNKNTGKSILKSAFGSEFPIGYFEGSKKGFEAPLTNWLKGPLKKRIEDLFSRKRIESQNIFNYEKIQSLIKKVNSRAPGDAPHTMWALLLFQYWYFRFIADQNTN